MVEKWKRIAWTRYYVSTLGRVRSPKGLIRKLCAHRSGYETINLGGNKYVHRLVAEAFHGPPMGRCVNHKNGVKNDNRAANLEWVTQAENLRHAREVLHKFGGTKGAKRPEAKLTDEEVLDIRLQYAAGATQTRLAADYWISRTTIATITRGDAWKHVPGPVRRRKRRTKSPT